MRMNGPLGKRILALVRDADYAHAGESEAIETVLAPVPRDPARRVLDAGCGRAGTAAYVQANGWGRVSGFDVDGESIAEARTRYPDLDLRVADASSADAAFDGAFDLTFSFNAFYAFPDQAAALRALRRATRPGGVLVLFDYVDRGGFAASELGRRDDTAHWRPLDLAAIRNQLAAAGWRLDDVVALHDAYERWYSELVRRIEVKQSEIVALAGADAYPPVHELYRQMRDAVRDGELGGAAVYATAI